MQSIEIFEVGPRDGLQPEPVFVETAKKMELINRLLEAGCNRIEVTSFVNPKWVPQMADAAEVVRLLPKKPGVVYSALVPNHRGLEMALECGLEEVVTIMSTSESHNKKNLNRSVAESLKDVEEINKTARGANVRVRSYIATAFGCPMEGDMDPKKALDIALALESFGSYEISLGDTTGMAHPESAYSIPKMIASALTKARLAVHYHKYFGMEFANNLASYNAGIRIFDSAAGGLGGCPYAPGAKGNCATEILTEMFHRMGVGTGIDQKKIEDAAAYAQTLSTLLHQKETNYAGSN
ncbi:MAG: hydroxymethylglutaryl-CoA lyase [Treponema sp.]|jgi:hydroxymethylglutaryl-CoA lyase|nr:hydroxymethylglutaryl-CoA lyase [Treponema sp.]